MQILQWLFQGAHEQEREGTKREEDINDQNAKGKDIILVEHHRAYRRTKRKEESKLGSKNLKKFALTCRKDIPKAFFYSTLNLKKLGSFDRKLHFVRSMNMKREETPIRVGITDSAAHVRDKVLPVTEASFSKSKTKDEGKGDKRKPISRMKEILRWAAASKTEKGRKFNGRKVLQFRRRGTVKSSTWVEDEDDDQVISSESSSAHSVISVPSSSNIRATQVAPSSNFTSTKGNWITTDTEFVVLEL